MENEIKLFSFLIQKKKSYNSELAKTISICCLELGLYYNVTIQELEEPNYYGDLYYHLINIILGYIYSSIMTVFKVYYIGSFIFVCSVIRI